MSCSPAGKYQFNVKEDSKLGTEIGVLGVEDKDEIQNKNPIFTIQNEFDKVFDIKLNNEKDGILSLKVVSISSFRTKLATSQLEYFRLSNTVQDFN